MTEKIPDRRPMIVDLLGMFSSEEKQLEYERNVPHVDITQELLSIWFDDQYHPTDAFFRSCFTKEELSALSEFNDYYDQRAKSLPDSQGTVRTWLASAVWREIMAKANETLRRIAQPGVVADGSSRHGPCIRTARARPPRG